MEPYSGMKDIVFGYDTDIHFENDDLMLCTGIDYIEREIYKLLITNVGDWKVFPNMGTDLANFVGKPNSRLIAKEIRERVVSSLKPTVFPANIDVKVVPTSETAIMCFIDIFVSNLEISTIPFQLDFTSGKIVVNKIDRSVDKVIVSNRSDNTLSTSNRPNKYWQRMR